MVNQVGHGNGVMDTYGKDPDDMGRPYRISTSNALSNWTSGVFEYDGAGNIKALRGMSEPVARPAATHQDYTYDAFANLTRITLNDTTYQDLPTSVSTNRLTASGYDPSGNMTAWGGYTYTYDPLNAMATLAGGGLSKAYSYDANGERLSFKDVPSSTSVFTLRGLDGKVLREYSYNGSAWSWSKDLVYRQGQLVAAIDGTGTRHFTLDHLGSPRLITDAGRAVLEYHAYWGYGQEIDTACGTERMKFTGHERDNCGNAGALDYMHARYYNPTIGRFLAVDQGNGKPEAPGSWNRYGYARGNPILLIDLGGSETVYFTVAFSMTGGATDLPPHAWNATRDWLDYQFAGSRSRLEYLLGAQATPNAFRGGLADPEGMTVFSGHAYLGIRGLVFSSAQTDDLLRDLPKANRLVMIAACDSDKLASAFGIREGTRGRAFVGFSGEVNSINLTSISAKLVAYLNEGLSVGDAVARLRREYKEEKSFRIILVGDPNARFLKTTD
jgi:RHS repeat-associated protein